MSKAALLELADRVEKASGPDRELDLAVGIAIGAANHSGPPHHRPFKDWAKPYTSSLDAAMTLVPPGWSVKLYLHPGENSADLYLLGDYSDGDRPLVLGPIEAEQTATPSLALTAAALRARAQQESKDA